MHCPLASSPGTNIFSASLLLARSNLATKWLTQKLSHNLVTMISAAHYLNKHGGKYRQLQTSPQPMSQRFENSVNVWNHPVSLTLKNEALMCIFSIIKTFQNSGCKFISLICWRSVKFKETASILYASGHTNRKTRNE